ncbi:MAG: DUF2017 family protein [Acidimicrobiales bacterium]
MPLFRRPRLFKPLGLDDDGRVVFAVRLAPEARSWLIGLADQLEQLLETDADDTRRLFPTAYPDDPELDAGYQILARQQLIDQRRAAIESMRRTVDSEVMDDEALGAWMGIVNDLRLVLGTRLDMGEDDHDLDRDDPEIETKLLYHELGGLLAEIVDALSSALPDPDDE